MLVLNSFGLQNALERAPLDIGHFFARCHSSAIACAVLVRDQLGPRGFMKYSPDSHFVQTSYAVLSLLKVGSFFESAEGRWLIYLPPANTTGVPGVP